MVIIDKLRDGRNDTTWGFRRVVVVLGPNEYGEDVTTCTVKVTSEPKPIKRKAESRQGKGDIALMRPLTIDATATDLTTWLTAIPW